MKMRYANNRTDLTWWLLLIFKTIALMSFFRLHAQPSNTSVFTLNHCIETALVTSEQTLIEALADYKIALAVLDRAVGVKNVKEIVE